MKQNHLNTSQTLENHELKKLMAQIHANAQTCRAYRETEWIKSVKRRLGITDSDLENCFQEIQRKAVA